MDMKVHTAAPALPAHGRLLEGRRGLVLGVANEHSIAWGCARAARARGAKLVLSCLNGKARPFVAPLADAVQAPLHECNVEQPGALQQLVDDAAARAR